LVEYFGPALALTTLVTMSGLGSRTKRVLTYGRRGHRIVNTYEEPQDLSPETKTVLPPRRQNLPEESSPKPKQRRVKTSSSTKGLSAKIAVSPKSPAKKSKKIITTRHPLALYESNTPGSPARPPQKRSATPTTRPKHTSPVINMDIIVIDEEGRRVSQERRVSRMDVQVNLLTTSPSPAKSRAEKVPKRKPKDIATAKSVPPPRISISSDTEDEPYLPPKPKTPGSRKRAIIISSDESEDDVVPQKPLPSLINQQAGLPRYNQTIIHSPKLPAYKEFVVRSQPRQLTPIRRGNKTYPRPPSSPSPSVDSDLDVVLHLADISISSSVEDESQPPPDYLLPLLAECRQATPHEFSAFIETFPFDPIVHSHDQGSSKVEFRKIGEASYSEVFGIGNVVLKIIPLRNEEDTVVDTDIDSPSPSDAKDVLKEINVTRSMGEICDGFIKLLRAYVVRGKYPSLLLSSWDEFNESKGSESIKPGWYLSKCILQKSDYS
jgi:serine/threonine-protein kinase haspin